MFGRLAVVSARAAAHPMKFTGLRAMSSRAVAGNIFYSKDHEYIRLDCSKTGFVGLSDYAQNSLGDLVYVDLPSVGTEVTEGQSFSSVESVKSANDAYSPVSGTIIEVNEALSSNAELINQAAETDAWIVKVELSNAAELDALMTPAEYKTFTDSL